ncbi:MAG: serine hydrolase domain-containing protein [Anaerolineae bacterium]
MSARTRALLITLVSICSLILVSPTLPALAQSADPSAKIDEFLTKLTESNTFSGSVLIARGDEVIFSKGYGYAVREFAIPNTPQTLYRIASLTKQFTGMAILQLQEAGKLTVHDSICAYVEGCPEAWKAIIIEQLLTHSSGIPDYGGLADFQQTTAFPITPIALIKRFINEPLHFQPGEGWEYSNSNYILLGAIIAKVSGVSYQVYLRQQMTEPLGLESTVYDNNLKVIPNRAVGYRTKNELAAYLDMSIPYAAGALLSSVEDLHHWTRALFTGKVVSQTSLDAMIAAAVAIPDDPFHASYGYGISIEADRFSHGGSINGFRSELDYYPEGEITVVVLCNLEKADPEYVAAYMWEQVMGKKRGS